MRVGYRILEHTADIGFEAFGRTREEALAVGTTALVSIITDPDAVDPTNVRSVEVDADNWEQLAVRYLNEIIYLIDGESFLPARAEITRTGDFTIRARLYGDERTDSHEIRTDVKAITYHQLRFAEAESGFTLRVFVDI